MNANELADELQKMFVGEEYDRLVHEIPDLLRQQQAEIEALKQIIDANNLSQNIGQFVKPDLKIEEVMSEHCTCYKLGYSQLNDYAKVKAK